MPVRVLIALLLLCSSAQAADPWTPFRKAFPGPREPVVATPLPPILPPELPPPPVIMLPEPEPLPPPVIADPPAPPVVVVLPPPRPRDVRSSTRSRAPLNITPPKCEGPPLTRSCEEVCDYATRYTFRELQGLRAIGIATGQIENRPISCQEDRDGKECIRKFCKNTVKK